MIRYLLRSLREHDTLRNIFVDRLTEPVHLNLLSGFVALFGSLRTKVDFDLIERRYHAFGLLRAADYAKEINVDRLTVIEFGVAHGSGLLNLCKVGKRITEITGVKFDIVGFDTGVGLPSAKDFRDHPEYYSQGDYALQNKDVLLRKLPENARIEFGNVGDTVRGFLKDVRAPIGFISVDLDYYSSTVDALTIFDGPSDLYLPMVVMYFDDIKRELHNRYCGALLAIEEFNRGHDSRKITKLNFLNKRRIFRNAEWIEQMYLCHIFDHAVRSNALKAKMGRVLTRP
jgi:hypothetical protein